MRNIEKHSILIVFFTLGIITGGLFTYLYLNNGSVSSECVVDEIEIIMNESVKTGYLFNGVAKTDSNLNTIWDWYNRYSFISRYVLERNVELVLIKCKN